MISEKPLVEVNLQAIRLLYKELGVVDAVRFLRQFSKETAFRPFSWYNAKGGSKAAVGSPQNGSLRTDFCGFHCKRELEIADRCG